MSNDKAAAAGYQPPLYALGERVLYQGHHGRISSVSRPIGRDQERLYGVTPTDPAASDVFIRESKIELLDYSPRIKRVRPARVPRGPLGWQFALGWIAGALSCLLVLSIIPALIT